MTEQEVKERVYKVVSKQLRVQPEKIQDSSDFVKDLGAESIQSIELVAAFEQEFGITMDEESSLEVKSVGKAIQFIKKAADEQGK